MSSRMKFYNSMSIVVVYVLFSFASYVHAAYIRAPFKQNVIRAQQAQPPPSTGSAATGMGSNCCKGITARCEACRAGISFSEYCAKTPGVVGCDENSDGSLNTENHFHTLFCKQPIKFHSKCFLGSRHPNATHHKTVLYGDQVLFKKRRSLYYFPPKDRQTMMKGGWEIPQGCHMILYSKVLELHGGRKLAAKFGSHHSYAYAVNGPTKICGSAFHMLNASGMQIRDIADEADLINELQYVQGVQQKTKEQFQDQMKSVMDKVEALEHEQKERVTTVSTVQPTLDLKQKENTPLQRVLSDTASLMTQEALTRTPPRATGGGGDTETAKCDDNGCKQVKKNKQVVPNPLPPKIQEPLPKNVDTCQREFNSSKMKYIEFVNLIGASKLKQPGAIECTKYIKSHFHMGGFGETHFNEYDQIKGIAFTPRGYINTKVGLTFDDRKSEIPSGHNIMDFSVRLNSNKRIYVEEVGTGRTVSLGTYLPGDDISILVHKEFYPFTHYRVTYRLNCDVIYTSKKRPIFPLRAQVSFYNKGEALARVRYVGGVPTYKQQRGQYIQFTNYERDAVAVGPGGRIRKNFDGSNSWNAGAFSINALKPRMEVVGISFVIDTNKDAAVGLARHDDGGHVNDIDYGFVLDSSQNVYVREHGQNKGRFAKYTINDEFQIRVNNVINRMEYYIKGKGLIYTSKQNIVYPLFVDVQLRSPKASISELRWIGEEEPTVYKSPNNFIQFTHFDGLISEHSGTVEREQGTGWNTGAVSAEPIQSANDVVNGFSFVPEEKSKYYAVGFSRSEKNLGYSKMDFCAYLHSNRYLYIYEKGDGAHAGRHLGKWEVGDTITLRLNNQGTVDYLVNEEVRYVSKRKVVFPLFVDASLYNAESAISRVVWIKDDVSTKSLEIGSAIDFSNLHGIVSSEAGNLQLPFTSAAGWHNIATSKGKIESEDDDVKGFSFIPRRSNQHQGMGLNSKGKFERDTYEDVDYYMGLDSSQYINIYEQGKNKGRFGKYSPGDICKLVINAKGFVEYWVGNEVRYTSFVKVSYPLYAAASIYTSGAELHHIQWEGSARTYSKKMKAGEFIEFSNFQGATNSKQGVLTQTTKSSNYKYGAYSYHGITGKNNVVGFSFRPGTTHRMVIGLSAEKYKKHDNNFNKIDYAIYLETNRYFYVYERGTSRGHHGVYNEGDEISIYVTPRGKVVYTVNGEVRYTSKVAPSYPLYVDAALYDYRSFAKDCKWVGKSKKLAKAKAGNPVAFTDFEGTTSTTRGALSKNQNMGSAWNGVALSANKITEDDSTVRGISWQMSSVAHARVGLTRHRRRPGIQMYNIEYALDVSNGNLNLYEGNKHLGMYGKYKLSDVLSIRINDEHRLEYLVNNLVIHTSEHKTVAYPLYVQAALYGSNAQLTNMKWVGERKVFKGALAVGAPVSFHNFGDSYSKRPGELQRFNTIGTRWSQTVSALGFGKNSNVTGISAVIPQLHHYMMFGLTTESINSNKNIDFAFYIHSNNHLYIYHNNVHVSGSPTPRYYVGDKILVVVNKSTKNIEYWLHNAKGKMKKLYTSKRPVETYPLYAVNAMYSGDSFMKSIRWTSL